MSKLLAGVIAALLVGVGVAAASSLSAGNNPTGTSTIATTDSTGTTETTETTGTTETTRTTGTGPDISGPCDEAEHANEPRCTGAATATDDDDRRSGRGQHGDDEGDDNDDHSGHGRGDDNEDRSGSNSGSDD